MSFILVFAQWCFSIREQNHMKHYFIQLPVALHTSFLFVLLHCFSSLFSSSLVWSFVRSVFSSHIWHKRTHTSNKLVRNGVFQHELQDGETVTLRHSCNNTDIFVKKRENSSSFYPREGVERIKRNKHCGLKCALCGLFFRKHRCSKAENVLNVHL